MQNANAFKGLLKTVKGRGGGILEKIEHNNNIQPVFGVFHCTTG